jgi:hypothetical protein
MKFDATIKISADENLFYASNFTLRASRRLPYAVLPRVRSKNNYDFTFGRLADESLRLVQKSSWQKV